MNTSYSILLLTILVCFDCVSSIRKEPFKSVMGSVMDDLLAKGQYPSQMYDLSSSKYICELCNVLMTAVIVQRQMGMSTEQILAESTAVCTLLQIESRKVCEGILKPNVDIFINIIDKNNSLDATRICGLAFAPNHCDMGGNYQWSIDIPAGHTVEKPESTNTNTFNVLHITDIHFDSKYAEGKVKTCNEPTCCVNGQTDAVYPEQGCGHWGEYSHADTPLRTIEETFKFSQTQNFDYVYLTGDLVSHRVWETSPEDNAKELSRIFEMFDKYYNVPVYPVIGNHEPHPVNTFSTPGTNDSNISTDWLYKLAVEKWSKWLPMDEVKDTILKGGFYTVSPRPGFRIVVLNNNVCSIENWWLIDQDFDPYGQLQWFSEVLLAAETNNERVHLLLHIPTGSSYTLPSWSKSFNRIVERFANTISAQFYGHSHKDEFYVFYNESDLNQAINVGWNGASINADKSNPSYKIYQIDDEVFDVVDFEEWTFNLTAANEKPEAALQWYQLYKFKETFGVKSMNPEDINELVYKMAKNHDLIDVYYKFLYRNSDYALKNGCNNVCQKHLLCAMVKTEPNEDDKCQILMKIYDANL